MYSLKLVIIILAIGAVNASNRGFILTAPKRLLAGSIEMVCISLHNTTGPANVSLDLLHKSSDEKISFTQHRMTKDNECIELPVYPTPETAGRLQLEVKFDDMLNYSINSIQEVFIQQNPLVVLIQTDKPVYKPGQLVQFRILTLTHDLKPVILPLEKVWLESPSEIRLAQWSNLKTQQGLVHLDFQLSQEPILGTWNIKVSRNNSNVEIKTFEVREYVLPRFEVTITPPAFILADSQNLTWKICAKYSYGQPVKGNVHIDVQPKYSEWVPVCDNSTRTTKHSLGQVRETWHPNRCIDPPMGVKVILPLAGCTLFNVTGAELGVDQLSQHNDPIQTIHITAVVWEANTDIQRNVSTVSTIRHDPLTIEFLPHTAKYFKPHLPYQGKLRVLYPNSLPAEGKTITVCVRSRNEGYHYVNQDPLGCRNFTSDSQGFVHFTLEPQDKNINLTLTATATDYETKYYSPDIRWHVKMNQPTAYLEVQGWHSPSNSFIEVSDDGLRIPRCNYHHTFRVYYTKHEHSTTPTFYYLIKARGDLILFNRVNPVAISHNFVSHNNIPINLHSNETSSQDASQTVDQFGIKLLISPKMSPVSQLLVYYVRDDGETVAATHTLNIKHCYPNKVSIAWQEERQFPGAPAVFHLAAAPDSLCGISAVDKSTSFLVSSNPTSSDVVFKKIRAFHIDEHSAPQDSGVWDYCDSSKRVDDFLRKRRRSLHPRFFLPPLISDASQAFNDFGVIVMTDLTLKTKPCYQPPQFDYDFAPMLRSGKALPAAGAPGMPHTAYSVVETSGMRGISVPVKGGDGGDYSPSAREAAIEVRSFFPETWLWELVDTGKNGRAKLRRELPHTVTDWVGSAMCVSPQQGLGISSSVQITAFQPFFVELVLPYAVKRGEIVQLKVALYSFLSHSIPVRLTFEQSLGIELLSEESSASNCVEQHANWVHHYKIRATDLGEVNLTVSAEVDSTFPTLCGPETLISRRDVLTKPLLVKPEGFPVEITKSVLICAENDDSSEDKAVIWDLHLPSDVVDSSARGEINIVSDLMGPTLQNLGSLVQLPMGCGEQNMILFVPNLHVVNYLQATEPNVVLQAEAIKNMEKGYQRELNYRHDDGSYSAFGKSDKEGSMWLTAFVVKTFAQARSHIFVDEKDLEISLKWISKHQLENGCFPIVGQVLHHDLRGGLNDDKMSTGLTAYILISLLETGLPLPHNLADNAKYCLLGDGGSNIYSRALITYALALLGDQEVAQEHMRQLIDLGTVEQELMYWQKAGSESRALNVEMTAYAILALVKLGGEQNLVTASKAVRWISQHRNANGGFVSTQDTVVALEALAKYSASLPTERLDLNILITTNAVERHYYIGQHDRLLLKRQHISEFPAHIEVIAHGSGCTLVQSWLRYNVHNAYGDDALELKTKISPTKEVDQCSQQSLQFCVRYKPKGQSSNMAVLEVSMVSGYIPVKDSLQHLDNSIHVKRWEIQGDQVNFYFDSLSNDEVCLKFTVEEETEIDNLLPANVKLYDYYQPEMKISKSYVVTKKCDTEFLPEPIPGNTEQFNDTSDASDKEQNGLVSETAVPLKSPQPNAIQEKPIDNGNLIRSTKPRLRRRKLKSYGTTTESYSTRPSVTQYTMSDLPGTQPAEGEVSEPSISLPQDEEMVKQLTQKTSEDVDHNTLQLFTTADSTLATPTNEQFVNVDHDLDFPEGIEGPATVYMLPDTNQTQHVHSDAGDCPVCWKGFPSNFSPIYCSATAVYKAILRKSDTMRLLLDLTPSKNVLRLRKVIKIDLPSTCLCQHLISENSTVLMVLDRSLDGRNELHVDSSVNIWHVPSQQGPPEEVKRAKILCGNS